jgi:excisionase family DNA binding protein
MTRAARFTQADRAYTVASLAAAWHCSEGVIRKAIRNGELGCFRLGTLIRIPAEEVARFECRNIPSSDSAAAMQSSIETPPADDTESDFRPRIALGQKRRLGGVGPQGATVLHGRWGA